MVDEGMGEIEIIPIAEEHIEGFHRCLDSVARERRYLAFVQAPPLASVQQFVQGNIASQVPQFVAIRNKEVVGWCDISPHKREGFTHGGELGMGVRRDVRRRGIGTKLVRVALRRAEQRGLERIELEVLSSNAPAIKLYENLGFVVEGVKRKARKLDGQYDDIVQMALFI